MARKGLGGSNRYPRGGGSRPGGVWVGTRSRSHGPRMRRIVAWSLVGLLLSGTVVGIVLGLRGCSIGADPGASGSPGASSTQDPGATPSPLAVITPEPTAAIGLTEDTAIPLDDQVETIIPTLRYVGTPAIYGNTMAYAAGKGSIQSDASVLSTLYLYDFLTGEETEIASTTLKGEISEIHLNENYIVWTDSDNQQEHRIFRYMRFDAVNIPGEEMSEEEESELYGAEADPDGTPDASPTPAPAASASATPSATPTAAVTPSPSSAGSPAPSSGDNDDIGIAQSKIAELRNVRARKPRLKMYNDNLIYTSEDTDLQIDQLYLVDMLTGEDTSLAQITDESAYGSSPPDIAGDLVIWAMHDPEQPEEERSQNEKSAIFYVYIDRNRLEKYEIDPETSYIIADYWRADMYVDRPQANDDVWIWTDTLGRGGNLWLRDMARPDADPYIITSNSETGMINSISLIEGYVVYCKESVIYAYDYRQKLFYRLSSREDVSLTPSAGGRRVIWFPKTGQVDDVLRTVTLP